MVGPGTYLPGPIEYLPVMELIIGKEGLAAPLMRFWHWALPTIQTMKCLACPGIDDQKSSS